MDIETIKKFAWQPVILIRLHWSPTVCHIVGIDTEDGDLVTAYITSEGIGYDYIRSFVIREILPLQVQHKQFNITDKDVAKHLEKLEEVRSSRIQLLPKPERASKIVKLTKSSASYLMLK